MHGHPIVIDHQNGWATYYANLEQMTMRYAHLAPDVARDAVRLLDNRTDVRCSLVAASGENAAN